MFYSVWFNLFFRQRLYKHINEFSLMLNPDIGLQGTVQVMGIDVVKTVLSTTEVIAVATDLHHQLHHPGGQVLYEAVCYKFFSCNIL